MCLWGGPVSRACEVARGSATCLALHSLAGLAHRASRQEHSSNCHEKKPGRWSMRHDTQEPVVTELSRRPYVSTRQEVYCLLKF